MAKVYESALVVGDTLFLLIKIIVYIIEGIYRLLVPVKEKSVSGEIVLITGAGHGIGRELALKYASLGATVVCWDVNQRGNEETVNEIKKLGAAKAYAYKCDVSNREEVFKVAEKVKEEVGNVTILINNAGIMPTRTFLDYTPEEITRQFNINVLAHFWCLQAFLPGMIQRNYGHIVAISSMSAIVGQANLVPYSSTKYAVRGLMEALKEETRLANKTSNVRFTTIYPYMVNTGLCKKPKTRFPSILSLISTQEVADQIIKAQRRNYTELCIPSVLDYLVTSLRCTPEASVCAVKDFLDSGVEPES